MECEQKKSPNVYKSCPKMISLEKWYNLTPLQKLHKIVGDLGQLIVAIGFKKLPKVQQIAKSGHTATVTECTKLQVKATWGTAAYIITLYANRCIKSKAMIADITF